MRTGQELLESAVCYALAGAGLVMPQLLPRPTPCASWDLETLLDHLSDSIGVLGEAIATAGINPGPAQGHGGPGRNPVGRLRGKAVRLLGTCAAGGLAGRRVAIGDRGLTASMVAVTGAIEITVHGWDIFVACGAALPVPPPRKPGHPTRPGAAIPPNPAGLYQ
jgi:Mycothiol maleylpyruvate isomerase N-terminal domain